MPSFIVKIIKTVVIERTDNTMNKKQKSSVNLFFSAFLVVAYVVCAYFFDKLTAARIDSDKLQTVFRLAIYVVFGLILFYATRVGDGKQIVRFSLSALILMVIPSIYVLCCVFFPTLPFASYLTVSRNIVILAAIVLGYGLPYTFTSGFELAYDEEEPAKDIHAEESDSSEPVAADVKEESAEPTAEVKEEKAEEKTEAAPAQEVKPEPVEEADDEIDSLDFGEDE